MVEIPIKIGHKLYHITTDSSQFIIGMKTMSKSGNPGWVDRSFYPNIDALLRALVQRKLRASDAETLKELLQKFDEIQQEITDLWTVKRP